MAASTAPALPSDAPPYERHRPEQTPLYALVEEHFPRFLQRLEAEGVSPRPRAHLTRYHGVFAPNFKHRHLIVANRAHQTARETRAPPTPPMSWMQRLKRVFHIDIERCGVCGATLRVIACIETPDVFKRILAHLATPAPPLGAATA